MSETKVIQTISKLGHWLEQDDIEPISSGYQRDAPETETETDKETNTESVSNQKIQVTPKQPGLATPPGVSEDVWTDFVKLRRAKRSPLTKTALAAIARETEKAGWALEKGLRECCARGWIGFKADWVANDSAHSLDTGRWQDSTHGVKSKGVELGIEWRPGVTFGQYVELLERAIEGRK